MKKFIHILKAFASSLVWGLGQCLNLQFIKGAFFFLFFIALIGIECLTGHYFSPIDPYDKIEDVTSEKFSDSEADRFYKWIYAHEDDVLYKNRINQILDDFDAFYKQEVVKNGKFTIDAFISYTANDLKKNSPTKYYELIPYLNEGSIFKDRDSDLIPGDEKINDLIRFNLFTKTYFNPLNNKEYTQQTVEGKTTYVNILDNTDTVSSVESFIAFERTGNIYRYNDKVYAEVSRNGMSSKYVNITNLADIIDPNIDSDLVKTLTSKKVVYNGHLYFDQTGKVYIYYNPELSNIGYNQTVFSSLICDYFNYVYSLPGNEYDGSNYSRFLLEVYFDINPDVRTSFEEGFNNFFYDRAGFFVKGIWSIITMGETSSISYHQTRLLFNALLNNKMAYKVVGIETISETVEIRGHISSYLLLKGLISTLLLLYFIFIWIWNILDAYKSSVLRSEGKQVKDTKWFKKVYESGFEYIALLPALITITFISIMPILFGFLIAFTSYSGYTADAGLVDWVGFKNFFTIFSFGQTGSSSIPFGSVFWKVFIWTCIWGVSSTATVFFGGFFQALIINSEHVPLKKFWRTVLILPWAVPAIISQMIFAMIFKETGILNGILDNIGIYDVFRNWGILGQAFNRDTMNWFQETFYLGYDNIQWFTNANNKWFVRIVIIIINIWLGFPYYMALMSGIMTNIDRTLYEAAEIDGATKFQVFKNVTFPLVMLSTAPLLVMCFSGNFNNFGVIYFMTEGGAHVGDLATAYAGDTDILISWMYRLTVDYKVYNMASVFSILIFIIVGSIAAWNYSRTKAFKED